MKSLFTILTLSLAFCGCLSAATYYVDFVGGNNANAGTATGTAWQHCPGDSNATITASSTALVAGDTVRFKGGVTYIAKTGITNFWSGSSGGGFISYIGNEDGAWGTGSPILTSTNAPISMFTTTAARSWLRFSGLLITNVGGYREDDPVWSTTVPVSVPPGGGGLYFPFTVSDIIISNCVLSEIGQWTNAAPMSNTVSVTGRAINFDGGGSNIIVTGCDISRCHSGVTIKGVGVTQNIMVTNHASHGFVNWGVDINPATGGTLQNIRIADSRFWDCAQFDNNRWGGYGDSPHRNHIFARTSGFTSTWTNIVFERDLFWDDDTNAAGGTSLVYVSEGPSVDIISCLFYGRGSQAMLNIDYRKNGVPYQRVRVLNCTFGGSSRMGAFTEDNTNPDQLLWLNNAMYRTTSTRNNNHISANPTNGAVDFNLYFSDYSPATNHYVVHWFGYTTLPNWRTWTTNDINSSIANPLFKSIAGLPSTWNLHPSSGSPLLTGGTNLTSLGLFAKDLDGVALPSSGAWHIGAYATTGDAPPPTPNQSGALPLRFLRP